MEQAEADAKGEDLPLLTQDMRARRTRQKAVRIWLEKRIGEKNYSRCRVLVNVVLVERAQNLSGLLGLFVLWRVFLRLGRLPDEAD